MKERGCSAMQLDMREWWRRERDSGTATETPYLQPLRIKTMPYGQLQAAPTKKSINVVHRLPQPAHTPPATELHHQRRYKNKEGMLARNRFCAASVMPAWRQ